MSWAVVILLPAVFVLLGTIMTIIDGTGLDDGWNTLWMRSFVFYGLFRCPSASRSSPPSSGDPSTAEATGTR